MKRIYNYPITGAQQISVAGSGSPAQPFRIAPTRVHTTGTAGIVPISIYFVALLVISLGTLYSIVDQVRFSNSLVIVTLCLIGVVSAYNLSRSIANDGASLRLMFWFYNLFFFSVAPIAQHLTGYWIFSVTDSSMLIANVLILLQLGLFSVTYSQGQKWANRSLVTKSPKRYVRLSVVQLFALVVLCTVAVFGLAAIYGFDWGNSMIVKTAGGYEETEGIGQSSSLILLADFFIRPSLFFVFLFVLLYFKASSKRSIVQYSMLAVAFISALIMNFPTTTARFYLFAIYFGVLIVLYPPSKKRAPIYTIFLFTAMYLSKFVKGFRAAVVSGNTFEGLNSLSELSLKDSYYSGDFDGYEMFVHAIDYVRDQGIVWGRQILGAILFWIPRGFWPDKPIGTGAFLTSDYVSKHFYVLYTNVSCPPIAEAFINFSIPGVILMATLIGLIFGYVDAKYKAYIHSMRQGAPKHSSYIFGRDHSRYLILYPVMVGMSLFVLRGDMLSSLAYTSGFVVSFMAVNMLIFQRINLRFSRFKQHRTTESGEHK